MNQVERGPLRAAVIGCGAIAEYCHIPGYQNHPAVGEIILCDISGKILQETCKKFRIEKGYADYKELLKKEKPDLVSVCTPNYLHAEMVCAAVRKGIHVLCEKPMALSLAEAERIRKALIAKRVKFMVGFSHRFEMLNVRAKEMLASGKIGRPFMLRIRFGHEGPYPGWGKTDWFYDKKKAGHGALLDMGIHAMDLARYFLGDVRGVAARTATLLKPIRLDDNALMILEFESKALGLIDVSWSSKPGFTGSEIYGSGGTLIIDYERGLQFFDGEKAAWKRVSVRSEPGSWEREMKHFIDCVVKDDDPEPGFLDGVASLKVAFAAAKSAAGGRFMRIDNRARRA
ncbi:MAG TPA: Gfo/Idh/MocA family oxidoreductase [Firmicutes bacterium]|nr:Gfo/Idh/MocA family oxidoreductase [Bacillota bacterium]